MGTHPIFESDFDCLTARLLDFGVKSKSRIEINLQATWRGAVFSITDFFRPSQLSNHGLARHLCSSRRISSDSTLSNTLTNSWVIVGGDQSWRTTFSGVNSNGVRD